jgi:predicted nucleic acid-binding protein
VRFVLDGSVALSWCFKDERTAKSLEVLDLLETGEADVPAIWPMEIANVVVMALKRNRLTADSARTFLSDIDKAKITVWPFETRPDVLFASAQKHELTVYDAAYIDLALQLSLPLATFDAEMRVAAQRAGISLLV